MKEIKTFDELVEALKRMYLNHDTTQEAIFLKINKDEFEVKKAVKNIILKKHRKSINFEIARTKNPQKIYNIIKAIKEASEEWQTRK